MCELSTHADVQASLNTNERGYPHLYPTVGTIGGRDSRRQTLEGAMAVFLESRPCDFPVDGVQVSSTESVTNKYPVNHEGYSGI